MSNDIKKYLGKRIKELRSARKLTQQEFAELANMDFRNVSGIECGRQFPSRSLEDICRALNTSIFELFDFEHHAFTPNEMREYIKKTVDSLSDDKLTTLFRITKDFQ